MGRWRWLCAWGYMHVKNNINERNVGCMDCGVNGIGEYEHDVDGMANGG